MDGVTGTEGVGGTDRALTLGSVRRLKILWTRSIGVFVRRTVPIIGEVILAYDVSVISYRSAGHYNQLVKLEDRL